MHLKLKKIEMENFKCFTNAAFDFEKTNFIYAQNGKGKTTIADAFMWVFFDSTYNGTSRPNFKPLEFTEGKTTVRVAITFDIDDKQDIILEKTQKLEMKETDEGRQLKSTNAYTLNGIDKKKTEIDSYLKDLGVNSEHFLIYSNIDIFLKDYTKKEVRQALRDTLFSMITDLSDLDICKENPDEFGYIGGMLQKYTMNELLAMQANTLSKIRHEYGKDGELLQAKIDALKSAKVDVNIETLNKERNDLQKQLSQLELITKGDAIKTLNSEIDALRKQKEERLYNSSKDKLKAIQELQTDISLAQIDLVHYKNLSANITKDIENFKTTISNLKTQKDKLAQDYKLEMAKEYDGDTKCPVCGNDLPQEQIENAKAKFNEKKKRDIDFIVMQGKQIGEKIKAVENDIEKMETANNKHLETIAEKSKAFEDKKIKLAELQAAETENIDVSDIDKQIAKLEYDLSQYSTQNNTKDAKSMAEELKAKITEIDRQIGMADNNANIDKQIEELKDLRKKYENSIAGCEKMQYQLNLLNEKKSKKYSEEISDKFNKVAWLLFKHLKNGNLEECCIPMTKGDYKVYGEQTNNALELEMKLDIVNTMQKHFNEFYPVFIDNAECMDKKTRSNALKGLDIQTLLFIVDTDSENLKIEKEN